MSQYHPDADPQFVAVHSHYDMMPSDFRQSLFSSFDAAGFIALESDMADFWSSLWGRGYKIVSINEPLRNQSIMTTLPAETARELYLMIARLKAIRYESRMITLPGDADAIDINRLLQGLIFIDRAEQSLCDIGGLYSDTESTATPPDHHRTSDQ